MERELTAGAIKDRRILDGPVTPVLFSVALPLMINNLINSLYNLADGLWVHLQEHEHRNEALPRFLYEQTRKTVSFELKIAALYAGKRKVAPGRYARDGLALTCSKGDAETFWEETFKLVEDSYELDDVERIWLGADGGGWCGPGRLEEKVPEGCEVSCSLDPFHIMQKICRAFPEGPQRDWAVNLAVESVRFSV